MNLTVYGVYIILYRAITTCYYCDLILYILRRHLQNKSVSLKGEMWGQLNLEMFLKI